MSALLLTIRRFSDKASRDRETLLRSGVEASGAITSMHQTALIYNGQPQVVLDLSVTLPGHPPYAVQTKQFVPMIYVGRLTDGKPLSLRVDPVNRQRFVIDWSSPGPVD